MNILLMDGCMKNKIDKVETKSDLQNPRSLKRPGVPFVSENPLKKPKKSEDAKPVSYIHQSKWIADRYEKLLLIGKGSFGMVYRAQPKNKSTAEYVAIKEILRQTSIKHDDQRHVVCEIELVQKLGGKNNILPTIEVHRDMGNYVVMEYFPHDDFKKIVNDMDAPEIIMYVKNLVSALNYLHGFNIIHRDTKPDNFLYNRRRRRYALIDFGLSQYYSNNMDRAEELKRKFGGSLGGSANKHRRSAVEMPCLCEGKLVSPCTSCQMKPDLVINKAGTPRYLAPEILIGATKQTTKIDIWATGMILFYMVTRKYPYFHAKENLSMAAELSSIFGTQSFLDIANENGMDLSFGGLFRPLNIIHFAFSLRYQNLERLISAPIQCDYCNDCFQTDDPSAEIGCYCCQMDVNESIQALEENCDKEMAQMLSSCLKVKPSERISSEEFVNKFPLT